MEITKREILFSSIIIAVLLGIGILISKPITTAATDNALNVASAVRVDDSNKFGYIKRTNVGTFLAEGELIANDTIRLLELSRGYSRVVKIEQEYCCHVETYTTTDSKGRTTVHTRTYWSWDDKKRDDFSTEDFTFLGEKFTAREIRYGIPTVMDTIIYNRKVFGNDRRWVYHTAPITVEGMMEGNAADGKYNDLKFRRGAKIERVVELAEKRIDTAPIVFWVFWGLLIVGAVVLFYVAENHWLY